MVVGTIGHHFKHPNMNAKSIIAAAVAITAVASAYMHKNWDEWFVLPELRQPVIQALKDPDSAQFRNERRVGRYLCGEVNAKNSLGGYVGFKRYMTSGADLHIEDHGVLARSTQERSTEAIIKDLDVKIDLLRQLKREPTKDELEAALFEQAWKTGCARA